MKYHCNSIQNGTLSLKHDWLFKVSSFDEVRLDYQKSLKQNLFAENNNGSKLPKTACQVPKMWYFIVIEFSDFAMLAWINMILLFLTFSYMYFFVGLHLNDCLES